MTAFCLNSFTKKQDSKNICHLHQLAIHLASQKYPKGKTMSDKKSISTSDLLMIANQLIQDHDDYIPGMRATSVEEKMGVLVFKGEYFLDDEGLPTENTTHVFNMFKFLAHQLSPEFTLAD